MLLSQFSNIRRTQFDQSSPVHPVSESSGGTLSVTYIQEQEQNRTGQDRQQDSIPVVQILEDTASYAGLLLAPLESFFCRVQYAYYMVLANFWCPLVTLVTFSSNLSNFKKNPKSPTKKNRRIQANSKYIKKS